jgi:Flp pilus assembly protein TadG
MRRTARTFAAFCRDFARNSSGGAAVEMAFVAPVLGFLGAMMIDFGLGVYTKMAVANAAQAGAAYAQLNANCTASTCYNQVGCSSNSPACSFDQAVVNAAQIAANGTIFMTAPAATAEVLFCCISAATGAVDLGAAQGDCTQPGSAAPTCTGEPTAGTYVYVHASASFTTLLPYGTISSVFNLNANLPSPLAMSSNYLVRIQ